jgi:molybdopterin molybdotransferase
MIGEMVANYGFRFKDLGVAGDNAASQVKKLKDLIMPEVLLTSAGVSAGKYDIVADTLTSLGLEVLIRKVALKPGKPLVFGKIGRTLYFGLPGNPVSAAVVYKLFVEPALLMMAGSLNPFPVLFPAVSESAFKETGGRLHFARGFCYYENGWRVKTTGHQGSHIISSMAAANCLIPIPPAKSIKPGNTVMVQMLEGQRVSYEATFRAFSEWLS